MNDFKNKLQQFQHEAMLTKRAMQNLADSVEARKSTKVTTSGSKKWKEIVVPVDRREDTIYKQRAQGWLFHGAVEMPNNQVKLQFYKAVENDQIDGVDKSSYAEIAKVVRANHPNSSPALIRQKVEQAVNVYKTTGVMPKSSTQPKMGEAKSVEVPIDQRDATVESYRKDNWRYLSEKQNTDTGITQIRFEKM